MLIWLNSPLPHNRGFILLDRDGVFNINRPDYVKNIREVRFYPDALQALELLNRKNISVIIISNQSAINRGIIPWGDFWEMHDGIVKEVEKQGGKILAALYCPHRPDEHCGCRKPSPAMLLEACRLFNFEIGHTCFIGDHDTDMQAARNAGCQGIRICRPDQGQDPKTCSSGDTPVFTNLLDAVSHVYG